MAQEIVIVGFTCSACGRRVPVLSSATSPPKLDHQFVIECACGYIRKIPLEQIQQLEIWKERPMPDEGLAAD